MVLNHNLRGGNNMIRYRTILLLLGALGIIFIGGAFGQEDREGCKDHPMFTRMPNFYIDNCKENEFDEANFIDEKGKEIKVEGKYYFATYEIKKRA